MLRINKLTLVEMLVKFNEDFDTAKVVFTFRLFPKNNEVKNLREPFSRKKLYIFGLDHQTCLPVSGMKIFIVRKLLRER